MIDGVIFAVDVAADFGFGHGAAHGGCWFCDGVAAEIDWNHERFSLVSRRFKKTKKGFLLRLENCLVACFVMVRLCSNVAIRILQECVPCRGTCDQVELYSLPASRR